MEKLTVLHAVTHFFTHASPLLIYSTVALILALESCGIPIVNSTLLLLTGALASQGHGDIWILCLVAICGSIAGANLAYLVGARGGRTVLLRVTQWFHLDPQHVEAVERWFQRSGIWMVFASRIIPYIRPYSCFPAGIARMPFTRFFVAASLGSILWCSMMLFIGWSLGKRWDLALRAIQTYTLPTLAVLVLLFIAYVLILYRVKKTLNRRLSRSSRITRPLHESDLIHA
jgi:membrane protein DedA with SNARE-associated domain